MTHDPSKVNYYFILTAGRYMYNDTGDEHSLVKMKVAISQYLNQIKKCTPDYSHDNAISEARSNSDYRFFSRAILIEMHSKDESFDPDDFEIVDYESFKIEPT